jgi:hypothetical protein
MRNRTVLNWLLASCALLGTGPALARDTSLPPVFDDIEQRTFRFFWETTNPANGLVPDRYPTPSFSSVAAVGFGLTAYPIGVERGYITRQQARDRVLATLRFFRNAPQSDGKGMVASGYKGFFYHFLDMKTGLRYNDKVELSTVDTALFLAGALFCESYFDGSDAGEQEIRKLTKEIYERVDWRWAQARSPSIALGWEPESGFHGYDWKGYNEAMLIYVLALGSPTHPVQPEAWKAWTSTYDKSLQGQRGEEHLGFPSLFVHQYSHVWIDFRGIRDEYMRGRGYDSFENSDVRAAGLRSGQSAALQGLWPERLGHHRQRRPGRPGIGVQRHATAVPHLFGARHRWLESL